MGFGDRFKDLTQQAKEKVAENREKIQEAVDAASVVANERTNGKYANKIMKVSQKTGSALDKIGADGGAGEQPGAREDAGADTGAGAAATGNAAGAGGANPQYSAPVGDPPSFADEAPEPAAGPPTGAAPQAGAGSSATGDGPKFDDD
jgi:hypothetical protein